MRRALLRIRLHPDTYARHAAAAALVAGPGSVLDVGGAAGALAAFLPGRRVATANVAPPADVVFDGAELPVGDESFDCVTSLDVVEHIPPDGRARHIAELARIARRQVILCCPLGTAGHVAAEAELLAARPHPMLAEHADHGLPTLAELTALFEEAGLVAEARFQGDYRAVHRLFRARSRPLLYAVRRLATAPDTELTRDAGPHTNRVFLVGLRTPRAE